MHIIKAGFAALTIACAMLSAPAIAHEPPISPPPGERAWVELNPVGVDLGFTCSPHPSGDIAYCSPMPDRYGKYVKTANWRLDRVVSMPGTCQYNRTYGYTKNAVWVAGKCVGQFMAPNLRYGDEFNHERALSAFDPRRSPSGTVRAAAAPCCVLAR